MTELTPERIRDAAEVLRELDTFKKTHHSQVDYAWLPGELESAANRIERELAEAAARRYGRVEELAQEMWSLRYPDADLSIYKEEWERFASALIDRYPALLESSENSND